MHQGAGDNSGDTRNQKMTCIRGMNCTALMVFLKLWYNYAKLCLVMRRSAQQADHDVVMQVINILTCCYEVLWGICVVQI